MPPIQVRTFTKLWLQLAASFSDTLHTRATELCLCLTPIAIDSFSGDGSLVAPIKTVPQNARLENGPVIDSLRPIQEISEPLQVCLVTQEGQGPHSGTVGIQVPTGHHESKSKAGLRSLRAYLRRSSPTRTHTHTYQVAIFGVLRSSRMVALINTVC